MHKCIVKNVTDSLVYNVGHNPEMPQLGENVVIHPDSFAVVDAEDAFIKVQLNAKRIEIVPGAQLPDEATDADFQEYVKEDPKSAVAAFYSLYDGAPKETKGKK